MENVDKYSYSFQLTIVKTLPMFGPNSLNNVHVCKPFFDLMDFLSLVDRVDIFSGCKSLTAFGVVHV